MRITRKDIDRAFGALCHDLGKSTTPWIREEGQPPKAVIGAWYIDIIQPDTAALYTIHEMTSEGGAVSCPIGHYRHNAGEFWRLLVALRELVLHENMKGAGNVAKQNA